MNESFSDLVLQIKANNILMALQSMTIAISNGAVCFSEETKSYISQIGF